MKKSRTSPSVTMAPKASDSSMKSSISRMNSLNDIVLQAIAVTTITSSPSTAPNDHADDDSSDGACATNPSSSTKEDDDDDDDFALLKLQELLLMKEDLNLFRFDATCPTEKTTERRWSDISCAPYVPSKKMSKFTTTRGVDTSPTMPRRPS